MLNMDFTRRVVIDTGTLEWVPSPMAGVWRKPLAREEAERGHATSIVRYEPGARFKSHPHPLGEEILVLRVYFRMSPVIFMPVPISVIPRGSATRRLVTRVALSW